MKRRISGEWAYFEKWVGLPLFGGGAVLLIVQDIRHIDEESNPAALLFVAVWLVGASFACWYSWRLKHVSVDEYSLFVTNYLKEIKLPLSSVERVTYFGLGNIRLVTIHLREPSAFGAKITFSPPYHSFFGLSEPPVVGELRKLARESKKRGAVSSAPPPNNGMHPTAETTALK